MTFLNMNLFFSKEKFNFCCNYLPQFLPMNDLGKSLHDRPPQKLSLMLFPNVIIKRKKSLLFYTDSTKFWRIRWRLLGILNVSSMFPLYKI